MTAAPAHTTLEDVLATVERDAEAAVRALHGGGQGGQAAQGRGRRRSAARRSASRRRRRRARRRGRGERRPSCGRAWRFDVPAYFASGEYAKELLAAAADAGVQAFESDERILSYPSIVAVSPADTSMIIDKKKDRRVRPVGAGRPPRRPAAAAAEVQAGGRSSSRSPRPTTWSRRGPVPPSSWPSVYAYSPCCRARAATTPNPSSPATCTSSTRAESPPPRMGGDERCPPAP